ADLGGREIDLGALVAGAQGGEDLSRALDEPARGFVVALQAQGVARDPVQDALFEPRTRFLGLARGVDGEIQGLDDLAGRDVELAQPAAVLDDVLARADALELVERLLVAGAGAAEV